MSMDPNLVRRVSFAVVAIPVALGLIWYGGLPLALLLAVAGFLGARELFDLAADPAEKTNLVGERAEVAERLQGKLKAWQESVLKSLSGADYRE